MIDGGGEIAFALFIKEAQFEMRGRIFWIRLDRSLESLDRPFVIERVLVIAAVDEIGVLLVIERRVRGREATAKDEEAKCQDETPGPRPTAHARRKLE